jgi:uncharacterized protein (TIGR02266 family)
MIRKGSHPPPSNPTGSKEEVSPEWVQERRREVRVILEDHHLKVRVHSVAAFLQLFAHNISMGGMFLASPELHPVGTVIRFQFETEEEGEILEGTGIVTWVREKTEGRTPRGMGIRFLELSPPLKAFVEKIVAIQKKEVKL